jgi:hypothetical protein
MAPVHYLHDDKEVLGRIVIHVFPHGLEDRLYFPVGLGFFSILHHVRSNSRQVNFTCQSPFFSSKGALDNAAGL